MLTCRGKRGSPGRRPSIRLPRLVRSSPVLKSRVVGSRCRSPWIHRSTRSTAGRELPPHTPRAPFGGGGGASRVPVRCRGQSNSRVLVAPPMASSEGVPRGYSGARGIWLCAQERTSLRADKIGTSAQGEAERPKGSGSAPNTSMMLQPGDGDPGNASSSEMTQKHTPHVTSSDNVRIFPQSVGCVDSLCRFTPRRGSGPAQAKLSSRRLGQDGHST